MAWEMFYTEKEHIPVFKIIWLGNHMEPLIEFRHKTRKSEKIEIVSAKLFILHLMQVLQDEDKRA